MAQVKRQVARHIRISTLRNGEYVKKEGWEPNYVLTSAGDMVSRVNIIGIVITEPKPLEIQVDDGSAILLVRQFDEHARLMDLKIGDPILLIGRPREYDQEIYVIPEIVKVIKDPFWMKIRQKELLAEPLLDPAKAGEKEEVVLEEQGPPSFREQYETIYALIRKLDDGRGADIEQVLQSSNNSQGEQVIKQLILEGEVFEMSPGKLKVLD